MSALLRRLALWLLLVATAPVWAQDLVAVPALSGRVIDTTGTLTSAQRDALSTKLAALEAQHGAQVVVLMVPSTKPEDIVDYTQRVGDTWKIGRRDVGDGLLIVVAKNDRRMRIAPAKSLEGAVPDLAARRIIDDQMTPAFRQNDFAGGLNLAVDQLSARIAGENLPAPSAPSSRLSNPGFDLEDAAILLFVGVPLIGGIAVSVFGRPFGSLVTGGAVGGLGWWLTASALIAAGAGVLALVLVGALGFGSGGGRRYGGGGGGGPIIWGGGGGHGGGGGFGDGGGFSSGGGGDFGGGGASGDW